MLEFMSNGNLKTYLNGVKDTGEIRQAHMTKLSIDVANGFAYLQERKFVHRDIAARNILLSDDFTAKFGDLGMTRQLHSSDYYRQGSTSTAWALPLRWMAPESYTDGTWNLKTDVWMFAVLLWGELFLPMVSDIYHPFGLYRNIQLRGSSVEGAA